MFRFFVIALLVLVLAFGASSAFAQGAPHTPGGSAPSAGLMSSRMPNVLTMRSGYMYYLMTGNSSMTGYGYGMMVSSGTGGYSMYGSGYPGMDPNGQGGYRMSGAGAGSNNSMTGGGAYGGSHMSGSGSNPRIRFRHDGRRRV